MRIKEYLKVIFILPFNVVITIPILIFLSTRDSYLYTLAPTYGLLFYISMLLLAIGLFLTIWSVQTFYIKGGEGTPAPWKPISNLIISGPYRYVRNPMILGVVFLLLCEATLFDSIPLLYWTLSFFFINIIYFKYFEERDLINRFGADYEDYRNKVFMFLPKITPYKKG